MRIIKDADQRKNEILDAAEQLFTQKGFDGTSTNEILEAVGIARGTLYYHFKSKEDIMDALIQRHSSRLLKAAKEIAEDKDKSVYERIIQSVMTLKMDQSGKEVIEHIHRPQNALMHQKVQRTMLNGLTPILAKIICEGIEQGLFHTPFPYECVEMLVVYASTVFDGDMLDINPQEYAPRANALIFNVERMLGVKSGTLSFALQIFEDRTEDCNG
ncbi:TetR/AcrR family transcriptional regulator [Clostridium boliviensis]|uniref:TetR/AcrR family transcriptional regulator n=1 Tax=Clostridium boliviensis TaxID=318465 RepID=A0ABU4GK66_9CLOT|nr:TetR/AcrR family transcriptional regulator [Clostridium boliviensis]MDW2798010.1 TetR/AcrR family transcriptional regulator [Clostridium boliviensis]